MQSCKRRIGRNLDGNSHVLSVQAVPTLVAFGDDPPMKRDILDNRSSSDRSSYEPCEDPHDGRTNSLHVRPMARP